MNPAAVTNLTTYGFRSVMRRNDDLLERRRILRSRLVLRLLCQAKAAKVPGTHEKCSTPSYTLYTKYINYWVFHSTVLVELAIEVSQFPGSVGLRGNNT